METDTFTLRDGTRCFARVLRAASPPRGTLVIVHGVLEHGAYYEHVAQALAAEGWDVVIPDLRGMGHSSGTRMHVAEFEDYLRDLDDVLERFSRRGASGEDLPTALLGQSLGGLIAIRFAQSREGRVQALVLTAPLLRVALPIHPWILAIGRQLSQWFPRLKFRSGIRSEFLSRNADYLERRRRDPLVRGRVTGGWYRACESAMRAAWAAPALSLPVLVLQGPDDKVTSAAAACEWAEAIGADLRRLPGQRHAILQEPEQVQTLATISRWLAEKVGQVGVHALACEAVPREERHAEA